MTKQKVYCIALEARGESCVKVTPRYIVYSRAKGGFYYLGRAGSLRVGACAALSRPVAELFKTQLQAAAAEVQSGIAYRANNVGDIWA